MLKFSSCITEFILTNLGLISIKTKRFTITDIPDILNIKTLKLPQGANYSLVPDVFLLEI
jgi:hypothetical protein